MRLLRRRGGSARRCRRRRVLILDVVDATLLQITSATKRRTSQTKPTLPLAPPFRLDLLLLLHFGLLFDHPKQGIATSLELLRGPTLAELVEPEDREFRDILLDPLVYVVCGHPVAVEPAEEISVFLLAVHLPFCGRVVELQLLHRIFHGCDLLEKK